MSITLWIWVWQYKQPETTFKLSSDALPDKRFHTILEIMVCPRNGWYKFVFSSKEWKKKKPVLLSNDIIHSRNTFLLFRGHLWRSWQLYDFHSTCNWINIWISLGVACSLFFPIICMHHLDTSNATGRFKMLEMFFAMQNQVEESAWYSCCRWRTHNASKYN